jgi:hypothetical protein
MLEIHDAPAGPAGSRGAPAAPAPDDWLATAEEDLAAAHEEAFALLARDGADAAAALRHARSILVLQQILTLRALLRAGRIRADAACTALRGDHALGYFFGLAASGGDPTATPPTERALMAALVHVHGLVFGMAQARHVAGSDLTEVGAAFGDGLLAAEADLRAFALWRAGRRGAPRGGLLDGMPWAAWARGGDTVARAH